MLYLEKHRGAGLALLTGEEMAMPPYDLCLIIPTYNERENIAPLFARLRETLEGIRYEVIVVDDDSPDRTAKAARAAAGERTNLRVLERIGRRGLASACIEGMLATSAPYLAVMDADMQHDEAILPQMFRMMQSGNFDLVVGSRHVEGGSMGEMAPWRVFLSRAGRRLCRLKRPSDPMSGFFMIRRTSFEGLAHRLSGIGFKILLDLLLTGRDTLRVGEIPYHFRPRQHGKSKLDVIEGLAYAELLLDKLLGGLIPARFVFYCAVGTLGVGIHLLLLWSFLRLVRLDFVQAQVLGTVLVMMLNYALNNSITWRDRRRRGWGFWTGMLSYGVACSLGVAANVAVSGEAARGGMPWALAGVMGLMISSVWNYGVTSIWTWRYRRERGDVRRRVSAAEGEAGSVPMRTEL
jgi:dolichol-phosphate mannosyltransferase